MTHARAPGILSTYDMCDMCHNIFMSAIPVWTALSLRSNLFMKLLYLCRFETGSDVTASCSSSSEGQVADALQCILAQAATSSGRLRVLRHSGIEALAQRYLLQKHGKV